MKQTFDLDHIEEGTKIKADGKTAVLTRIEESESNRITQKCHICAFFDGMNHDSYITHFFCMAIRCRDEFYWKEATDDASELEKLLVPGETHTDIIAGHCTCGEPYALIKGSNHTIYRNGNRMAHCADGEQGIGYFRCTKCGGWLEKTFKADKEQKK